jgi:hypothetical protein
VFSHEALRVDVEGLVRELSASVQRPGEDGYARASSLATIMAEARPSMIGRECPSYCDGHSEALSTYEPPTG